MKTLTSTILVIIAMQLSLGGHQYAYAQLNAVGAAGQAATRAATRGYSEVDRTEAEETIDTAMEAETYIKSAIMQNQVFADQCDPDGNGKWDNDQAFLLQDNIPYANMEARNCGMEAEKLYHVNQLANELAAQYGIDPTKVAENCVDCTANGEPIDQNVIPPGEACSIADQVRFKTEPCNFYCQFIKPSLSGALAVGTLGLGNLVLDGITKGKDGCGTGSSAAQGLSCMGNIIKGLVKGVWEAISGLAKLVWEGVKAVGRAIKKGATKIWNWFTGAEDQAADNIQAASKADEQEVQDYQKDERGWWKRKFDAVVDFLKELVYVGLYERESKCMDCAAKGQLMCEIGGRVISDVVGFTFTLGAGYGAIKVAAAKLAPKLTSAAAKVSALAAKSGAKGAVAKAAVKTGNAVKKGAKFIGNVAVAPFKLIGRGVIKGWEKLSKSKTFIALMKRKSNYIAGVKVSKSVTALPAKILIKTGRGIKNGLRKYIDFDNRVFARGNDLSMRIAGKSKFERSLMWARITEPVFVGGARIDKNGQHVMRIPSSEMTPEKLAELKRAGIKTSEVSSEGEFVLRGTRKQMQGLKDGKFSTNYDRMTGVPLDKDGNTLIKRPGQPDEIRNIKTLSKDEVEKLRNDGALFTTKDHPVGPTPADPNDLTSFGLNVGEDGKIVIKNPSKGTVEVVDAKDLTRDQVSQMRKDGVRFTTTADPKWEQKLTKDRNGLRVEGDEINQTAAAKNNELRQSDPGAADQAALQDVNQIIVNTESGLIAESSAKAKQKLLKQKDLRLRSNDFDGITDASPTEFNLVRNETTAGKVDLKIEVDVDGQKRFMNVPSMTKIENIESIQVYQNGTKAIMKKTDGSYHIYDLGSGKRINNATIEGANAKLFDDALGNTVNGKSPREAALAETKANLDRNGVKYTEGPNGELKIEAPNGCEVKGGGNMINLNSPPANLSGHMNF